MLSILMKDPTAAFRMTKQWMTDDVGPAVRDLTEEVEYRFNFAKSSTPIQGGRNTGKYAKR